MSRSKCHPRPLFGLRSSSNACSRLTEPTNSAVSSASKPANCAKLGRRFGLREGWGAGTGAEGGEDESTGFRRVRVSDGERECLDAGFGGGSDVSVDDDAAGVVDENAEGTVNARLNAWKTLVLVTAAPVQGPVIALS